MVPLIARGYGATVALQCACLSSVQKSLRPEKGVLPCPSFSTLLHLHTALSTVKPVTWSNQFSRQLSTFNIFQSSQNALQTGRFRGHVFACLLNATTPIGLGENGMKRVAVHQVDSDRLWGIRHTATSSIYTFIRCHMFQALNPGRLRGSHMRWPMYEGDL